MTRTVTLAATQMACGWERRATTWTAPSAWCARRRGAAPQVVLLQELFETPYFPIDQDASPLRPGASARGPPDHRAAAGVWPPSSAWCCR